MPAVPQMYTCDFIYSDGTPCTNQFAVDKGYSFITLSAKLSDAQVGSFNFPENQQLCCCLNQMVDLAKQNIDAMKQKNIDDAAQVGFTIQFDPPTE